MDEPTHMGWRSIASTSGDEAARRAELAGTASTGREPFGELAMVEPSAPATSSREPNQNRQRDWSLI
jgi:hypothetical protein